MGILIVRGLSRRLGLYYKDKSSQLRFAFGYLRSEGNIAAQIELQPCKRTKVDRGEVQRQWIIKVVTASAQLAIFAICTLYIHGRLPEQQDHLRETILSLDRKWLQLSRRGVY